MKCIGCGVEAPAEMLEKLPDLPDHVRMCDPCMLGVVTDMGLSLPMALRPVKPARKEKEL